MLLKVTTKLVSVKVDRLTSGDKITINISGLTDLAGNVTNNQNLFMMYRS